MDTPPIPPNCRYFKQIGDVVWFDCGADDWRALKGSWLAESVYWPPIIAALCRVAWLDEAERLRDKSGGILRTPKRIQAERDRDVALENAAAWKTWGEAK